MIVVGENLKALLDGFSMCSADLYDETSISIKLDSIIFRTVQENDDPIRYGLHKVDRYYKEEQLENGELIMSPQECVLACSNQTISLPLGYIGFMQTKGTLARMFVAAHCTDAHIEPGFSGKITLELMNFSPFQIIIPVGSVIAQLFIMRCSTDNCNPYEGKYQNCDMPTLPLPFK